MNVSRNDIVVLNSGGPLMQVLQVNRPFANGPSPGEPFACCVWLRSDVGFVTNWFAAVTLRRPTEDELNG